MLNQHMLVWHFLLCRRDLLQIWLVNIQYYNRVSVLLLD